MTHVKHADQSLSCMGHHDRLAAATIIIVNIDPTHKAPEPTRAPGGGNEGSHPRPAECLPVEAGAVRGTGCHHGFI